MFEIQIKLKGTALQERDLDDVLMNFLSDIGYLKEIKNSNEAEEIKNSVPYRLFKECFLLRADRYWTPEELMATLNTTKPTLYRHLNRLKNLDLLDEIQDGKVKKYRLRNGKLSDSWHFVEANVKIAMDNYRKIVDYIEKMVMKYG